MEELLGKGASAGIVLGPLYFLKKRVRLIAARQEGSPPEEQQRLAQAISKASEALDLLYDQARAAVGEEDALVFQIHRMMLEDQDYLDAIEERILRGTRAEYAVMAAADEFAGRFERLEDAYMRERAADVRDISNRLLDLLCGTGSAATPEVPVVIAADDLLPSETIGLNREKTLGIAVRKGGLHSHAAILARSMGIPAVIGLGDALLDSYEGRQAALDGAQGILAIDPDAACMARLAACQVSEERRRELLEQLRGCPSETADGHRVTLCANVGTLADVEQALEQDAEGIGLFRSEFLFIGREDLPDEEEQFEAYRAAAERMGGKRVIVRTMDIGADKQAPCLRLPIEDNPALGMRGIRLSLAREELFLTQLRALLRASAYGRIAIMLPMVTSVWEVRACRGMVARARAALGCKGLPSAPDLELGIMIETPAAVLISDRLAQEADFFSIGTNDLSQYTLAVDRQHAGLDRYYDPHHPALLRMLQMVTQNAHDAGIWVGLCGELAADPEMTGTLAAIGIDELSVSPAALLELRARLRMIRLEDARAALELLLK